MAMKAQMPGGPRETITSLSVLARNGMKQPDALLKTPTAQLAVNGGSQHPDKRREGGHGPTLADQVEHLLPTPTARTQDRSPEEAERRHLSGRSTGRGGGASPDLASVAVLLPTPRATDGTKGGPNQRGSSGDLMLPSAVMDLLPTPRASDTGTPGRRASEGFRPPLSAVLLPTPRASDGGWDGDADGKGARASSAGWGLRNESRAISRGAPTSQPSADGQPSSDAPLPGQLSLDELANG